MSRVQFADVFIRDPVNSFPSMGSLQGRQNKGRQCVHRFYTVQNTTEVCQIGHIRILGIGVELACNGGSCGRGGGGGGVV